MRRTSTTFLLVFILLGLATFVSGQDESTGEVTTSMEAFASPSSTTLLKSTWKSFWNSFRTAVLNRDMAGLRKMMTDPFDAEGELYTPNEWFKFNNDDLNWQQMKESVGSGTGVLSRYWRSGGGAARITNNKHLVFVRGKDGQWRWAGVGGH